MELSILPTLNAGLNSISALLLTTGYVFVRQGRINQHRACMVGAFSASTLFLISYLIYHFNVGSVAFTGQGAIRVIYFAILITHVLLAALILPLAMITLIRAIRGQFNTHRKIARLTLPVWLYVSVTGVVIYAMLYL